LLKEAEFYQVQLIHHIIHSLCDVSKTPVDGIKRERKRPQLGQILNPLQQKGELNCHIKDGVSCFLYLYSRMISMLDTIQYAGKSPFTHQVCWPFLRQK